jgi:Trk K+ transport system NAD-binding subunit
VEETIEITPSKEIVKIEIDQKLVGKTLRELNLEERFKVKIVSIISKVSQKQKNGKTIEVEKESEPSPDYQLKSKDLLVIECEKKKVEAIEKEIGAE